MIASPCINICKMDAQSGLCAGCFRTIDEIVSWPKCSDARRREILAALPERRLANEQPPNDSNSHGH